MKTAYEKAMERLDAANGPTRKLTDAQKTSLNELDKLYDARIAEQKLSFEARLATADWTKVEEIRQEMTVRINDLESRRQVEKDAIWAES